MNHIEKSNNFFACARIETRLMIAILLTVLSLSGMLQAANPTTLDAQTEEQLIAGKDPQLQICLPAIEALGRKKNPDTILPLTSALEQEQRALVRRYIVDALGNMNHPATFPALKRALRDPDSQVRQSAIAAMGLLGTKESQLALAEEANRETDPRVKAHFAYQLGYSSTPEAKESLHRFESDRDPRVKGMARQALSEEGQESR